MLSFYALVLCPCQETFANVYDKFGENQSTFLTTILKLWIKEVTSTNQMSELSNMIFAWTLKQIKDGKAKEDCLIPILEFKLKFYSSTCAEKKA